MSTLLLGGWAPTIEIDTPPSFGAGLPARVRTLSDCVQPDVPHPPAWEGEWFAAHDDVPAVPGALVVAVAVPAHEADHLLIDASDPGGRLAPVPVGVLPDGLRLLGWEVLGYELGRFHSWRCYDYGQQVTDTLAPELTASSLFAHEGQARAARDLIVADASTPLEITWVVVALWTQETP